HSRSRTAGTGTSPRTRAGANQKMTQIIYFLLNHLWQSTLVAALAWLVCRTMLKSNSPAVRFSVWMAVCVKFLVPFAIFVEAGHRLYLRPVLDPAQSQQAFEVVRAAGVKLVAAPFQDAPGPQTGFGWAGSIFPALSALWAAGATVVLIRW